MPSKFQKSFFKFSFQGELTSDLLEPIWLQELKTALREDYIDCDTVKFILDRNILPEDDVNLRVQIWQILLGVNGRSNSFELASDRNWSF